ncbi:MAG TPA: hypothetical protein VIJ65_02340 [Acidobacteriaceae bacterium]
MPTFQRNFARAGDAISWTRDLVDDGDFVEKQIFIFFFLQIKRHFDTGEVASPLRQVALNERVTLA